MNIIITEQQFKQLIESNISTKEKNQPYDTNVEFDDAIYITRNKTSVPPLSQGAVDNAVKYNPIKENWFHGSEDSREIDKIGAFGENKTTSIRYVNDLNLYREFQSLLNKYNTVNEKLYFETLNNPKYKTVWKDVTYKKPIFLSNKHAVANTYSKDKIAYDYQNSTPKTFEVTVEPGRTLTINAHGERFSGIPVDTFKKALLDSGITEDVINDTLDRFVISIRQGRIKTDYIGYVANQIFGFDIVDVVGVLDSYNGGNIKSTVRMVFDPNKIKIIN